MPDSRGSSGGRGQCQKCERVGGTGGKRLGAAADHRLRDPSPGFQPHDPRQVLSTGADYHPLWPGGEWTASIVQSLARGACRRARCNRLDGGSSEDTAPSPAATEVGPPCVGLLPVTHPGGE
eukprot:4044568-Pleurochrysis_carterae.AAC.1